MVLELPAAWRSYEDYLGGLNAKYKNAARRIGRDLAQAGCQVSRLDDLTPHAATLHALFLNVLHNAAVRPVTLPPAFFPALADALGDDFRCIVVCRQEAIVGFISVLRDGDTAVAYYIGFDRRAGVGNTVYLGLLHAVIDEAIRLGCRRISFGRTALEPKAGLGARPEPLWLWTRHRVPAMNLLIRRLLRVVPHGEPPERNPFKTAGPGGA
jgi:Acetyltransferase (GNAT) domain